MSWVGDAGTLLIAAGGLGTLTGVLLIPVQWRKIKSQSKVSDADAATRLSAAAVALLDPAQAEINRLESKLSHANLVMDQLTKKVRELQKESEDLRGRMLKMTKDLETAYQEIATLRGGLEP